jgi:pimeloyl-ACP methyl ester carboxylesterase
MTDGGNRVEFSERFVALSHGRTRYFERGDGQPILLLHGAGFMQGAETWLHTIHTLGDRHFRVLSPDLLGWGPSDKLSVPYSFAYLVDFVREFQDSLGIARSHIVGHSMGGWIASLLAYESPERVDKLVLAASGGLASRPLATMSNWMPPDPGEIELWADAYPKYDLSAAVRDRIRRSQNRDEVSNFQAIMSHMSHPETRNRYNTQRRLPRVGARTLALWGRNDAVNPLDLGIATAELIPKCELVVVESGHSIITEVPNEFNATVLAFLLR